MSGFEYKVVPAPVRGLKAKGIKGTPARFANALQSVMNDLGSQGWEYQRTDTLPVEERQGLTGRTTTFQNMLVFRRASRAVVSDAPQIAALIENQTDVLAKRSDLKDIMPIDDHSTGDEIDPTDAEKEPSDNTPAPVALAADAPVNDLLDETFTFPWNKRTSGRKPDNNAQAKDPHHAAE